MTEPRRQARAAGDTAGPQALDRYRAKRDFSRTPEPAAGGTDGGGLRFVVHRHEARRLHYDLRLEMDGVLLCFAVPRGFSHDPADKRLAVHTEDHPLDYIAFRGVIPKGQYGGGTMEIWDHGTYLVRRAPSTAAALASGEIKVVLRGRRLRGEWHLVRTAGAGDDWLLFKARDRYARSPGDPPGAVDLRDARHASVPDRPRPMRPAGERAAFSDAAWLFEMEFAGRRTLAVIRDGQAELLAADGGAADHFDAILAALSGLRAEHAVIDGVLVAVDGHGRPSRAELDRHAADGDTSGVAFYAFDLLHYEEWDVRGLPLLDRKALLKSILTPSGSVLYVDHVAADGERLAAAASAAGLQALVAKRIDSAYRPGRQDAWARVRLPAGGDAAGLPIDEALRRRPAPPADAVRVKLGNLDKVYWPASGHTKGDLIDYYLAVADSLLPYLRSRPIHLLRYPDGVDGEGFYQKQVPHLPSWVPTVDVSTGDEEARYIVCGDRDTLLYMVNLGSIDFHPWLSRIDDLDAPDWAVIDLDAKGSSFAKVVRVARTLARVLHGMETAGYPKTSGKSGMHVYVPLAGGYTYDQARMFCEGLARIVVREHRDIATVERSAARRGDRVYVDFLQNRREQTVVPPYAVRPVSGATVSAPLSWDELDADLSPSRFTLDTVPERLARTGDLFRDALANGQDLADAAGRLERYLSLSSPRRR
ncbi:MAG: non-homologous end-joining DNA ligase [Spirochaetaceae bacterium]|nr:non-homologous end-joining DNA ligase [Spirochaetaceae bacterium]